MYDFLSDFIDSASTSASDVDGVSIDAPAGGSAPSSVAVLQAKGGHPTRWEDFVGQERVKDQLRVAAAAARRRAEITATSVSMGHKIIVSPEPGSGKTTLALLAAGEAGSVAKIVKGALTEAQAMDIIEELGDGGVLIWDEFQQAMSAGAKHIQWLYHYLQHGVFMDGDEMIAAPQVTIICATTHLGELPTAVKQRFSILNLAPYSESEAIRIAQATWHKVAEGLNYPNPSVALCEQVAAAASRRPRLMQRIWEKVCDLILMERLTMDIDEELDEFCVDMKLPLEWAELTADGLTVNCVKYMAFLTKHDRPRGRDTIERATGIAKFDLAETEALLLEKKLLEDTGMGRKLTTAGRRRFRALLTQVA